MVNWFSNSNISLSIINLSMYALPMHSYMAYLVIYVLNDLNIDEILNCKARLPESAFLAKINLSISLLHQVLYKKKYQVFSYLILNMHIPCIPSPLSLYWWLLFFIQLSSSLNTFHQQKQNSSNCSTIKNSLPS